MAEAAPYALATSLLDFFGVFQERRRLRFSTRCPARRKVPRSAGLSMSSGARASGRCYEPGRGAQTAPMFPFRYVPLNALRSLRSAESGLASSRMWTSAGIECCPSPPHPTRVLLDRRQG